MSAYELERVAGVAVCGALFIVSIGWAIALELFDARRRRRS